MKALYVVLIVLSSTITCCPILRAQNAVSDLRKIQQAPASVRALMPKKAKHVFAGVWKMPLLDKGKVKSGEVLLHFYALPMRQIRSSGSNPTTQAYFLNIFTRSILNRKSHWRRLQAVRVGSQGSYSFADSFIMWLDPKQRRMPIIGLHLSDPADFTTSGNQVLIIFPKGLSDKPVVQSFVYWGTNSETLNVKFDTTDERGFLVVIKSYQGQNAEAYGFPKPDQGVERFGDEQTHMNLYWNGKQFSVSTTATTEQK